MAAAPMLMMGLGSIISTVGSIRQGEAAKIAGDYNAQVDDNNAVLAKQQAAEEGRRQEIVAAKQYGAIKANFGGSGLSGGTAMDVLGNVAANAELDNITIRHGGDVKAAAYGNDAALQRAQGRWAMESGYIGAAGHVLQGGATAAYYGSGASGGGYAGGTPGVAGATWAGGDGSAYSGAG